MFRELHGKAADLLALSIDLVNQIKASRQVHHRSTQRLIHWNDAHPVASDPGLVSQSLQECLPQTYRHVLDRMVIVYLQIALAFNLEVKQPVSRKQVKHVIEKRHTGVDAADA